MYSVDAKRAARAAAVIGLSLGMALGLARPALADVLVVRSNGPSAGRWTPGRSVPDATRIVLQKGDQLVLLDARGTRTLAGPGSFPATGGPVVAAPSTLLALAGNAGQRRARVGAVRNLPDGTAARPNIFFVDTAASGPMCVADPSAVQLWRAKADVAASDTVAADAGPSATVTWIKGQSSQPWPATLPVRADAAYRISGAAGATTVRFQSLETPPTDVQSLASGLIAHGCRAQLDVLIAATGGK